MPQRTSVSAAVVRSHGKNLLGHFHQKRFHQFNVSLKSYKQATLQWVSNICRNYIHEQHSLGINVYQLFCLCLSRQIKCGGQFVVWGTLRCDRTEWRRFVRTRVVCRTPKCGRSVRHCRDLRWSGDSRSKLSGSPEVADSNHFFIVNIMFTRIWWG